MKRIVIDVSKGALDYIREAVEHKHKSLMDYFDDCEAEANKPLEEQAWKGYFGAKRDDGIALTTISHPVANKTTKKTIDPNSLQVETIKNPVSVFGSAPVKAEGQPVSYTVYAAPKAVRKPRKVAAPYGLKKDGTPKSKPGRKA